MTSVICGISRFGPKAPFVMRSKELAVMPAKAEGIGGLDRDEEADAVSWLRLAMALGTFYVCLVPEVSESIGHTRPAMRGVSRPR